MEELLQFIQSSDQTVRSPGTIQLIAEPVDGGRETGEVALFVLDLSDQHGFWFIGGIDAMLFGNNTNFIDLHFLHSSLG